jgi:hypothetical protein
MSKAALLFTVFILGLVCSQAQGQALTKYDDRMYYTLQKAEITEIEEASIPAPLLRVNRNYDVLTWTKLRQARETLDEAGKTVDQAGILFDKIVNLGKKVYDFVAQGKAVANVESNVSTALPEGTKSWRDFSNWQRPLTKTYKLTRKNLYGMDVITLIYQVTFVYGGSYAGTGRYIAYATVEPIVVNVWFGFSLNAKASTPVVFNVGSSASPVAAMNVKVEYSVGSINPFNGVDRGSSTYFLSGRGEFAQLR